MFVESIKVWEKVYYEKRKIHAFTQPQQTSCNGSVTAGKDGDFQLYIG